MHPEMRRTSPINENDLQSIFLSDIVSSKHESAFVFSVCWIRQFTVFFDTYVVQSAKMHSDAVVPCSFLHLVPTLRQKEAFAFVASAVRVSTPGRASGATTLGASACALSARLW